MTSRREHATAAAAAAGVRIEVLRSADELQIARDLCDAVWPGPDGGTQVTSNLLTAIAHSGGYVSVARDLPSGDPVAAVVSIVGRHRTDHGVWESHLHSHMAAVLDHVRDRGIGAAIKHDQRAWAAEHDIPLIGWTFDPLVRRNARLNLLKLGARVAEYLPDFYGQMDDALNRGDRTDRLFVWWDTYIDHEPEEFDDIPDGAVVVDLPEDIVTLRATDPASAAWWRESVRSQMLPLMSTGWRVVGVTDDTAYVLLPPNS